MLKTPLFIIFLLISFRSHAYLSFGDGSDNCLFSTNQTLTKAIWNCDELVIDAGVIIDFDPTQVTEPVQFRVQGDADISGTIRVSADVVAAAGNDHSGPGGGDGGDCNAGTSCTRQNGSGTGRGIGGQTGDSGGFLVGNGGGGGGGGFLNAGGDGTNGQNGSNVDGLLGSGGSAYVTAASLETTLVGGSGGGAGGSGDDGGSFADGGQGGNAAGSVAVIVKGNITISGSILAVGGNGSNNPNQNATSSIGGLGGGGSGGAIYLVAGGTVSAVSTPTIDVSGGVAGTDGNNADSGNGGDGSVGIFRVDSASGSFSGSFSTAPDLTNTTPASLSSSAIYTSEITAACTYKMIETWGEGKRFSDTLPLKNFFYSFIFFMILFQLYKVSWRFIVTNIIRMTKS